MQKLVVQVFALIGYGKLDALVFLRDDEGGFFGVDAFAVGRIAADLAAKEIEADIHARKQASAIIIAEQGRWYTAIIRPLLAL